ncbi:MULTISPECIES: DUF4124 domain-containing protein [unclassified Lysobacter]|uniref:DUF4124 domain-containing protein n=1 Tax=unclassified Lysobacter TaxID=2635362 RepID=UPI000701C07E|nr:MULTISPECIES: DUF4124 domain-containing protein [unclassified Lysobacter]KQZ56347.1 hypothetical protein ASD53_12400 [Lysobacter sp. Root559]KRC35216.1 hypothetical protein ASE10_11180 [Lysobacter sp. Root76]KRD70905.1 hypothetical protein ASE45_03345 [Lysobacter sp. Root96]
MKLGWAIVAGIVLGAGLAWWTARDTPAEAARAQAAHAQAGADARAEAADPPLYRWRDAAGRLQITERPPKGRPYERLQRQPRDGIEVHGDRD